MPRTFAGSHAPSSQGQLQLVFARQPWLKVITYLARLPLVTCIVCTLFVNVIRRKPKRLESLGASSHWVGVLRSFPEPELKAVRSRKQLSYG